MTCPRCGTFEITARAMSAFRKYESEELDRNRYLLSGRARAATLEDRVERFDSKDFAAAEGGRSKSPTPKKRCG
jgi:hypothetical protein